MTPHRRAAPLAALALLAGCFPIDLGPAEQMPDGPMPHHRGIVADEALAQAVDDLVLGAIADASLPGGSVAIVAPGRVLYTAGFGWADIGAAREMQPDTPILLSSVSKTFVGIAAMQGEAAGELDRGDGVNQHLTGWAADNPRIEGETLTLQHLLTHNSGIEDSGAYDQAYAAGDPEIALDTFLEAYLTEGGDHHRRRNWSDRRPGEAFAYSNVGMSLAAQAIGDAGGQEFMDLVATRTFAPLGMDGTAYLLADLETAPATPYHPTRRGHRPWEQYGYPTYPDGMVRSGAHDMGRYAAAILGGGRIDGAEILSPDAVETMLTVKEGWGTDEDGQATAWARRETAGRTLFGHNGGDFGSFTELWIDREAGVGFVLLFNGEPTGVEWADLMDLETALLAAAEAHAP